MSTGTVLSKSDKIDSAIDKTTAGTIAISSRKGLVLKSMAEALEFSKLMALMGFGVPKHCRESPGMCLAICIQSCEWEMSPLAVARRSYVVNDIICYEAQLYHSVVTRRAPIVGRVKMDFVGAGLKRQCRVFAELSDGTGTVDYLSPEIGNIKPQNSPLWKNDPDQQLFYSSVRAFARRHFPDVMDGIYTVDEMQDASPALAAVVESDTRSKTDRLADRLLTTIEAPKPVVEMDIVQPEPVADTSATDSLLRMAQHAMAETDLDEIMAMARDGMEAGSMIQSDYDAVKSAVAARGKELSK